MKLWNIFSRSSKINAEDSKPSDEAKSDGRKFFNQIADMAHADPDARVRAEAQEGVKQLFPGGAESFDEVASKMIDALRDAQDEEKRHFAAGALVCLGEISIPYVKPLLEDRDPEVRRLAIQILVMIEKDQKEITGRYEP